MASDLVLWNLKISKNVESEQEIIILQTKELIVIGNLHMF